MKTGSLILVLFFLITSCTTSSTKLLPASPLPSESIGLYLHTEARMGIMGAPYTSFCNVNLNILNNTSIPIWRFPKTTFYGEQGGQFYALRMIEQHSGGISSPYSMSGLSVTVPRPPRAGKWNIFAVQEHSDIVYQNHLKDNSPKFPLKDVKDQDKKNSRMWTEPLVSNAITIEFAELGQDEMKSAERVIQGLVKAGQYKPEFNEPTNDPTKGLRVRFFRWHSK